MTPNGDTSNTSDTARADNPTIYTVYIIYVILFSVLIVLGNSLTTLSILCFTPSKTIAGTVISFVSLAEVCNVLGARIITIYVHFTREFRLSPQSRLCQVQGYFSTAARLATISSVCLLCVDRTLANFAKDFHHLKWRGTPFRIALSSIVLFSAFAASWPLFGFGKFVPAEETFNAHCIFQPDSFAVFVVCFLGPQLTFIATASCVLIFKSPSAFEASFRASSRVSVKNGRLQNPARHLHRRTLARMCGSIALLYFFCHTPWNVVVCLNLLSVTYPQFLGLICPTLTFVSALFSPLICGLMWSPYRRAYVRVLCWPSYECHSTSRNGEDHVTPLDSSTPGRSRTYSFWSADNFIDEDLHSPERATDVLFGPTSLVKPLEFNARELQMFEKETVNPDAIDISINDDVTHNDDVTNNDDITNNPNPNVTNATNDIAGSDFTTTDRRSEGGVVEEEEETIQFQSILNLIDELTDGKAAQQPTGSSSKVKRSRSNLSLLGGFRHFRSGGPDPTPPAKSGPYLDDIGEYIKSETRLRESVSKARRSASSSSAASKHLPQEQFWLRRLGRSQAWGVDARPRYLDYLVAERVKEYASTSEQPFFIDI